LRRSLLRPGLPLLARLLRPALSAQRLHADRLPCPSQANYILVRRQDDVRTPLAFGQTKDDAISLNLAHLRHQGAKLGANEVHIHLLAETPDERAQVEGDLTEAHFQRIAANAA
jgi:hypothetical protein